MRKSVPVSSSLCLLFLLLLLGCGAGGSVSSGTTPSAPSAPGLMAGNAQIQVSWTAVSGATAYEVWYGSSSSSGSAVKFGNDVAGAGTTITSLANGTTYYVWLKTKNGVGTSGFSPSSSATPQAPATNYSLTLTNGGGGTISSSPTGISCGSTCSASYPSGTSVTLTETPNSGYTFSGWGGVCSGAGAATTCVVSMTQAQSVTATFTVAPPPPPGAPQVSLVPTRTTGVAPLSVFFDSSATVSSVTTRPFHDLDYQWNFGDSGAGSWSLTGTSKNTDYGPIAAHVFEMPGTYTVTLNVLDGTNVTTKTVQVTVTDPNTVFSGTNTICVSTSGTFTSCPSGAQQITSSDFAATMLAYAKTGKRVLFRRGELFVNPTAPTMSAAGPVVIGAYGTGALPIIKMTSTDAWTATFQLADTATDWRIMDLELDGNSAGPASGFTATTRGVQSASSRLTCLRLNIHHTSNGLITGGDEQSFVDNTITDGVGTAYGGYMEVLNQYFAFLGNTIDIDNNGATNGVHALRTPYLRKSIISHNDMKQAGFDVIKMHAPSDPTLGWQGQYTEQVVVGDNKIYGSVYLSPQNNGRDERLRDIVFERNQVFGGPLEVHAVEVTVRNNLFLGLTNDYFAFADIGQRGIEPPATNVRVYNNTAYTSTNLGFSMVTVAAVNSNVTIKNNLAYAPNATWNIYQNTHAPTMVENFSSNNIVITNNSTNAQVKGTPPNFVGGTPSTPADFKLGSGSYGINTGAVVPVFSDYFGVIRPQGAAIDIGASEQ